MNAPHIAIIVLHYKNLADTRACLRSLANVGYPRYSIILVNNDAPAHAKALKEEFPNVTLIQNQSNVGFAEGNNIGIRAALKDDQTDAVLILNNDTEVEPDFLSEMAKQLPPPVFRRGSGGGDMIAATMMQDNDRDKVDNLGVVMMKNGLPFNRFDENQKLFCPSAGCALYSRKLLEAIRITPVIARERTRDRGNPVNNEIATPPKAARDDIWYFDRTYFAYAEDVDLGFRARLLGFEPGYAENAVVYHKGSASSSKLSDLAVYNTYRNLIWTQYKNYPLTLFLRHLFWLVLGWQLIFFGYLFKGRPLVVIKAIFDGVAGLSAMKQKRNEIQKKRVADARAIRSWFERGLFPKNLLQK